MPRAPSSVGRQRTWQFSLLLSAACGVLAAAGALSAGPPYVEMDYGPCLALTVEVADASGVEAPGAEDNANLVQKGLAIRLDGASSEPPAGAGGVARGESFVVFDTDLLRYAAGWRGGFIDWHGIIFDGAHNAHPSIDGTPLFVNPLAPGWAHPERGDFDDRVDRVEGRDGRRYGPLARDWAHWRGHYLHGRRVVLAYDVGKTPVLETPSLEQIGEAEFFCRTLQIGPRARPLLHHVITGTPGGATIVSSAAPATPAGTGSAATHLAVVDTEPAADRTAATGQLQLGEADFTIAAWVKTKRGGTILSKTAPRGKWVPGGKTLFVRDGRLAFDIGWEGVVTSRGSVDDDRWHHVAATHSRRDGMTRLYIDGRADTAGRLDAKDQPGHVVRLGYTATDFVPPLHGALDDVQFYGRALSTAEIARLAGAADLPEAALPAPPPLARWKFDEARGEKVANARGGGYDGAIAGARWTKGRHGNALAFNGKSRVNVGGRSEASDAAQPPAAADADADQTLLAAACVGDTAGVTWTARPDGRVVLQIPAGDPTRRLKLLLWRGRRGDLASFSAVAQAAPLPADLTPLTAGGPPRWDETLTTRGELGAEEGPFAVDTLTLPDDNPWQCWLRLGGFDFFADGRRAALCTWQGDVWIVEGLDADLDALRWRRIASGLFQPLGLKIVDEAIYVLGRDQITRLVDLDGDGESDFYENFNNDAQVTEHFHEFAMDLQTDGAGDFYYAKGARHAKKALVPQHGTIVRVARDGSRSEIVATGYRAPNGLCVNGDGTFFTSDQEGHWTPMNRINWVVPGGFYGNMWSHLPEREDTRHDPPLCWIHKSVDRSPAAQLPVPRDTWGPLGGGLLSLSYGTGRVWHVLHEKIAAPEGAGTPQGTGRTGAVMQGGIVRLPLPEFPTGISRGRFHPLDKQLYLCGLFGWSSNKTRSGGLYRVRHTGKPYDGAIGLRAVEEGLVVSFPRPLAAEATDRGAWNVQRWEYKRSASYGSRDYRLSDGRVGRDTLPVSSVQLSRDGRSALLRIDGMRPAMQMHLRYRFAADSGRSQSGEVHHTVHALGKLADLEGIAFDASARPAPPVAGGAEPKLRRGLTLRVASGDGQLRDVVGARMLALHVPAGASPTPLLPPGDFTAIWEGFIRSELKQSVRFRATGRGRFTLHVGGVEAVSAARGKGLEKAKSAGQAIELRAGLNPVRAELRPPTDGGPTTLRLFWEGDDFAPESLPPTVLASPADPAGAAPFDRLRRGRELFANRGCSHCHELPRKIAASQGVMPEMNRDNPSLAGVGARLEPAWLLAWLLDPVALRSHATMPGLFREDNQDDRLRAAHVATWLATLREDASTDAAPPSAGDVKRGAVRFEDLGCIACHTLAAPNGKESYDRVSLHFVAAKYRDGALVDFLRAPHRRYAWSQMPDFRLDAAEASDLAALLRARSKGGLPADPLLARGRAAEGRQLFFEVGCSNCHAAGRDVVGPRKRLAPVLGGASTGGCLAPSGDRAVGVPDYRLTSAQREALITLLTSGGESLARHDVSLFARRTTGALRCNACHARDGEASHFADVLFDEGEQGLPPEILPDLTWAGEKLQPPWSAKLLAGQVPVARPWLKSRMPAFSDRATWLAHGLAAQHGLPPTAEPPLDVDPALAEVGRRLTLKTGGFHCLQCHGVGDQPAEAAFNHRGVNFSHIAPRLRREYYDRWWQNPLRIDPGTKMPRFTPDGRTTPLGEVYGGDARRQFDALWHHLHAIDGGN